MNSSDIKKLIEEARAKKPRDIEYEVYLSMCYGCENEHYCHNACENCDEYQDEIDRLYEEEKKCI